MRPLRDLLFGKSNQSKTNKRRARRGLRLESLEGRQLMAVDFGGINGTVYNDQTGDGLTTDDVAPPTVTLHLYRDGGDGTFDSASGVAGGDDVFVETQTTDANGEFAFDRLIEGDYFVERNLPAGLIAEPGTNVSSLIAISESEASGVDAGVQVDSFSEGTQSLQADAGTPSDEGFFSAPAGSQSILGRERDLMLDYTSGLRVNLDVNTTSGTLSYSSPTNATGGYTVDYDGIDGSATLDPTGLGGVDLTNGGTADQLMLMLGADIAGVPITLTVYTDGGNFSSFTTILPVTAGGGATDELLILMTDFDANQTGNGADFTNVGAIRVEVTGAAAFDSDVSVVGTVGQTNKMVNFALLEPLTLGNLVWEDLNNNGVYDAASEAGIGNVAVNLYEDTDGNGQYTAGTDTLVDSTTTSAAGMYTFTNLLPGDYIVQLAQSNFNTGGVLNNFVSSSGVADPNNNVDNDDNGVVLAGQGIVSAAITLLVNSEPTNDGDTDSDTNLTLDFGVVSTLDIQIVKALAATTPTAVAGGELTYVLTILNNGPIDGTGVTVTDVLPSTLTIVSASASQGSVTPNGNSLSANLGNLASGATATITIVTTLAASATGTVTNTANVTSNETDSNTSNNQSTISSTVTQQTDLSIVKTDIGDPTSPGNTIDYTLTVTNNGPSNATGVVVTDNLPAGVTFVSGSGSQGTVTNNNGVITASVGNLASGSTATVTIRVQVASGTTGTISNQATVTGNEPDPVSTNNSSSTTTTVQLASLSGFTYLDADNDGVFDTGETPLAGVTVELIGTDLLGADVSRTAVTDATGAYSFDNLNPGTYRVVETQPAGTRDGIDTVGTGADDNGTAGADAIIDIVLGTGDNAVNFNFGEQLEMSKRRFLASFVNA
ncbi:Cna protein B-type domain protein [Rosistilla carotiformis]|uniref:Cna protein B-type domain protein n=1 Tax=Rosistilla carotiformis TaxID=2528017 RepID=A0A518JYV4_9BACT|nr:SdrD B-like domain-containing protein [Rosistilla carotiformis]QDV70716.1 Cna protein B-type domain protein [Rosistilla carotiformis]